jgi:hypothetical protein
MTVDEIGQRLLDLVFFALDHGVKSIRESGDPLVPFVVLEDPDGKRTLQRFVTERLENSVEQALAFAAKAAASSRAAVAYDGFVTLDGNRTDAVLVLGRDVDTIKTVRFAQRYKPKRLLQRFQTIGNAAFLGPGQDLG